MKQNHLYLATGLIVQANAYDYEGISLATWYANGAL